jgi:hypothetical protein
LIASTCATSSSTARSADLQLEDAVAALFQHLLGFGDVLGGVAAGQGPGHRQRIAHAAAQQLGQRHAEARACASSSAVSIAHLAKRLPWMILRTLAMAFATWPLPCRSAAARYGCRYSS